MKKTLSPIGIVMIVLAAQAAVLYEIFPPTHEPAPVLAGCNASSAQLSQTAAAGARLASCIIGTVLGGITDPLAIAGQCAEAVPAVIADVIDDVQAKDMAAQASLAEAGALDAGLRATLFASRERSLLAEAKAKAAAAMPKLK